MQYPSPRVRHPEAGFSRVKDLASRGTYTMRQPKRFAVYIMTNGPRSHVLYTGVTGNLVRRVFEHKNKLTPGFTSRYNVTRLVYYEIFVYPDAAIAREKEIKGWRRSKKLKLIEATNSHWHDLAAEWYDVYKPPTHPVQSTPDPSGRNAPQDDAV
ncbi:MAG: GIY-YIG nuclease family protein [Candidatus Sulfotelmatobacter sp.]